MNLRPIETFSTGTYKVTSRAAPTFVDGLAIPGLMIETYITASIQPANGHDLKALPEGRKGENVQVIYTKEILRIDGLTHVADEIEIDGVAFVVFKSERWKHRGSVHTRAYAAQKDRAV